MSDATPFLPSTLLLDLLEWKKSFQALLLFSAWDVRGEGVVEVSHLYPIVCSLFPPPLLPRVHNSQNSVKRNNREDSSRDTLRKHALLQYQKMLSPFRVREAFREASLSRELSSSCFHASLYNTTERPRKVHESFCIDDLTNTIDHLFFSEPLQHHKTFALSSTPSMRSSSILFQGNEFSLTENEAPITDEEESLCSREETTKTRMDDKRSSKIFLRNALVFLFGDLERMYAECVSAQTQRTSPLSKDSKWKSLSHLFPLRSVSSSRSPILSVNAGGIHDLTAKCVGKEFTHHEATSTCSFFASSLNVELDSLKTQGPMIDFEEFLSSITGSNASAILREGAETFQ